MTSPPPVVSSTALHAAAAAAGLTVLSSASWPETDADDEVTALAGFIESTFSPLIAEVAERALLRQTLGRRDQPRASGMVTAIVMVTDLGDVTSAIRVATAVDAGRRVSPLLFFQSVPNAVAGYLAGRWQLTGPVVCVSGTRAGMDVAALLIDDGDADDVLIVRVDLAVTGGGARDRAAAVLVTGLPDREGPEPLYTRRGAMKIGDIDHIELYVGDAIAVAQSLRTAYGFRVWGHGGPDTGLPGQRSVLLGHGDIRILLTSGLHKDHPASQFVARHGDGVAVAAFRTDSAATAYTDAVKLGGSGIREPRTWENDRACVVTAEVAGFGDVIYRLVERHGSDAQFQPHAIETIETIEPKRDAGADDDLLHIIDHLAVCVPAGELETTVAFHEHVFDFSVTFQEYIEIGKQGMSSKVVQSPSGGVTFTILEPDLSRQAGQVDDFLAWHDGAGVQHVAFLTDDIVRAVRTFTGRGVEFAQTPSSYYDLLAGRLGPTDIPVEELRPLGILVDRDHWGQMYQIFAKSTHIRRTYFLELIDRHGARTFGTSNIPALYAAKERELAEVRGTAGTVRA